MKFEPLTESHLPLLLEWFGRPHVAQWWDDTLDIDALRIKYLGLPAQQEVQRFIVMREAEAFGYIQKYRAFDHGDGWWRGWTDRSVVGIDQFIADEKNLGRGLGTAMIGAFIRLLFADLGVSRIVVDPSPSNHRAIACYRKAGFLDAGMIESPDGAARLMSITRSDSARKSPL